jgi:hypothetical protein
MIVVQVAQKLNVKFMVATPYENHQNYVILCHTIDTIVTVHTTLELFLYRAAKIS